MRRTILTTMALICAALVGCGGDSGPAKPQDDPEILWKAEESMKQSGEQEGGNTPVKGKKK
jgi:hypothetical protein